MKIAMTEQVEKWATDKGLLPGDPLPQFLKLAEEFGELSVAIQDQNQEEIADAIGDCTVVLTILAAQHGMSLEGCREHAWQRIKNRTGKTVGGVFIKDLGDEAPVF